MRDKKKTREISSKMSGYFSFDILLSENGKYKKIRDIDTTYKLHKFNWHFTPPLVNDL